VVKKTTEILELREKTAFSGGSDGLEKLPIGKVGKLAGKNQ